MDNIHMNQSNVLNNDGSKKYCSKCLSLLGDKKVKDHEWNCFCSWDCKVEFHLERRQDMDDILSNFK